MRPLALTGVAVTILILLLTWVIIAPDRQASMAEPTSVARDDVLLDVDMLGWGVPRKELRSILRERGYTARRQAAATLGFRNDDLILALAYEVTNKSGEVLTVFGGDTIGLGDLPIVTSDGNGEVRLLLTTETDPNVDFARQPHIRGERLGPGETYEAILSVPYPLKDQWKRHTDHAPETVKFCVGLTTDANGSTAASLGETGTDLYWPMGKPSPIEVCADIKR